MAVSKDEIRKRLRAARAYADFSQEELAERIETSPETVKRSEAGKRTPKGPELSAIAEACGLPREFFSVDLQRLALWDAMGETGEHMQEAQGAARDSSAVRQLAMHMAAAGQGFQKVAEALEDEADALGNDDAEAKSRLQAQKTPSGKRKAS